MDAARAAGMSDPERNPNFRRKWDAPPLKLKAPPAGGTARQGDSLGISSSTDLAKPAEDFKGFAHPVPGGAE